MVPTKLTVFEKPSWEVLCGVTALDHALEVLCGVIALEHRWQTQGLWAESGPPPCFIWPGTLFLPGSHTELSPNC